jgi:hypothetical protein
MHSLVEHCPECVSATIFAVDDHREPRRCIRCRNALRATRTFEREAAFVFVAETEAPRLRRRGEG